MTSMGTYWKHKDGDVVEVLDVDETLIMAKCIHKKDNWYHYLIGDFIREFTQVEKPKDEDEKNRRNRK